MLIDDTAGTDVDPDRDGVLVVFNATPAAAVTVGGVGGGWALHDVQAEGGDEVVKGHRRRPADRSPCPRGRRRSSPLTAYRSRCRVAGSGPALGGGDEGQLALAGVDLLGPGDLLVLVLDSSSHCASQPGVRPIANSTVNISGGNWKAS